MTAQEFDQCVDDFSDGLYRFLLKKTGDTEQARDLVQDTFEKFWKVGATVNKEKYKSFLFTTAYHLMIDQIRRGKKQVSWSESHASMLSHNSQYSDAMEHITNAIRTLLTDEQQSAILLRDQQHYEYLEIAEIMGIEPVQVRKHISKARMILKNYLVSIQHLI